MFRPFGWLFAVALLCGCNPLTTQTRTVQVQQLAAHPVPPTATYAVVVPPTSIGAAQLTDGIRIPGLTKVTTPDTADIVITASVGRATVADLKVGSSQVERIISSGGPSEVTVYSYTGTITVPNSLHIRSKAHGETTASDAPSRQDLTFAKDPGTNQRFTDPRALEWSFNQARANLTQQAELASVRDLQAYANRLATDQFTAHQDQVFFKLTTAHENDPRFAQAISLFDQAVVGAPTDATGRATRMQPALDLWQQIVDFPVGDDDAAKNAAKGAALFGQAVGLYLIGRLDDAERALIAAQALGVQGSDARSLTFKISEQRKRVAAQGTTP
jgi:hypothetical protein